MNKLIGIVAISLLVSVSAFANQPGNPGNGHPHEPQTHNQAEHNARQAGIIAHNEAGVRAQIAKDQAQNNQAHLNRDTARLQALHDKGVAIGCTVC